MSELFGSRLTVCIDAANLSGYLALAPTLRLIDELNLTAGWLPLTTGLERLSARQPGMPADDPLAAYKARRASAREKWARRELARDCERLGISVAQGDRHLDSVAAGLGMLFLNERGGDVATYLQRVYRRAYNEGGEVETPGDIAGLLAEPTFLAFAESSGAGTLDALQDRLLDAGVFRSPAYVVNGEVFQGREHLPLLRSMLAS